MEQFGEAGNESKQIMRITDSREEEALQDLIALNDDIDNEVEAIKWLADKGIDHQGVVEVKEDAFEEDALTDVDKAESITDVSAEEETEVGADEYFNVPAWEDEFWSDDKNVITLLRSALVQKHNERQEAMVGTGQQGMSMSVPAVHAVMTENLTNMALTLVNTAIFCVLLGAYRSNERTYDSLLRVHSQLAHDRFNPDVDKDMTMSRVVEGLQRVGISISSTKVVDADEYKRVLPEIRESEVRRGYRRQALITAEDAMDAGDFIAEMPKKEAAGIGNTVVQSIKDSAAVAGLVLKETGKDILSLPKTLGGFADGYKALTLKSKHDKALVQQEASEVLKKVDQQLDFFSDRDLPEAEIMHTKRSREQLDSTRELLAELENYESRWPGLNFGIASTANVISLGSLVSSASNFNLVGVGVNIWDLLAGGIGSNAKTGSIYYAHSRERNSYIAQAARNQKDLVDHNDKLNAMAMNLDGHDRDEPAENPEQA